MFYNIKHCLIIEARDLFVSFCFAVTCLSTMKLTLRPIIVAAVVANKDSIETTLSAQTADAAAVGFALQSQAMKKANVVAGRKRRRQRQPLSYCNTSPLSSCLSMFFLLNDFL